VVCEKISPFPTRDRQQMRFPLGVVSFIEAMPGLEGSLSPGWNNQLKARHL
jgi:hypothetical protein